MFGKAYASFAIAFIVSGAPSGEGPSSTVASADPSPSLTWSVETPPGCDAHAFRAHLSELLIDTDPERLDSLAIDVHLRISQSHVWSIELKMKDMDGTSTRRFEGQRCETVIEAGALVVAMRVDPTVVDRIDAELDGEVDLPEPAEEPPSDTAEETTEREPATEGSATEREVAERPHVGVGLGAYGGVVGLALPGATGTIGADAALLGSGWRVSLGARTRFRTKSSSESDRGGEFWYWTARATGCGVPHVRKVGFPLCAGMEVGRVSARGYGVSNSRLSQRPWLAARVVPGVSYVPVEWLALTFGADLGIIISRERYFFDGIGSVHQIGPIELGAVLGVEFRIFGKAK